MRRRILPLLLLALGACNRADTGRVGVVVSGNAAQAAVLAGGAPERIVLRPSGNAIAADTALAVAESFVADPSILAVVGHSNSAASLAASQIYNRSGLVQIAPTTTSAMYRRAGPWSFRMVPGDDAQARFLAAALQTHSPGARRVAVVYVNDDYGRGLVRELKPLLPDVAFEGMYSETDEAYLQELGAGLAAALPDVLLWLGRPGGLAVVLAVLRADGRGGHVYCGDACDSERLYANADGAFTGVRFVRWVDPEAPELRDFQLEYAELTGRAASSEALLTYDATLTAAEAMRTGARTRGAVRDYVASLGRARPPLQGLSGAIHFDDNGDMIRPYLLAEVTATGVIALTMPEG